MVKYWMIMTLMLIIKKKYNKLENKSDNIKFDDLI